MGPKWLAFSVPNRFYRVNCACGASDCVKCFGPLHERCLCHVDRVTIADVKILCERDTVRFGKVEHVNYAFFSDKIVTAEQFIQSFGILLAYHKQTSRIGRLAIQASGLRDRL